MTIKTSILLSSLYLFFSCNDIGKVKNKGTRLPAIPSGSSKSWLIGRWSWGNDERDFELTITEANDSLKGYYCAVAQSGNRVDCGDPTDTANCIFRGRILGDSSIVLFTSTWDQGQDTAKLTFLRNQDSLIWSTEKRNMMSWVPRYAKLGRS